MTKRKRRRFTSKQKAEILGRLLFKKDKVSDLAEEYEIQPSLIYNWQRQAEGNLILALETESQSRRRSLRERQLEERVQALEARLSKKDEVIAELSEEFVTLKKSAGNR